MMKLRRKSKQYEIKVFILLIRCPRKSTTKKSGLVTVKDGMKRGPVKIPSLSRSEH